MGRPRGSGAGPSRAAGAPPNRVLGGSRARGPGGPSSMFQKKCRKGQASRLRARFGLRPACVPTAAFRPPPDGPGRPRSSPRAGRRGPPGRVRGRNETAGEPVFAGWTARRGRSRRASMRGRAARARWTWRSRQVRPGAIAVGGRRVAGECRLGGLEAGVRRIVAVWVLAFRAGRARISASPTLSTSRELPRTGSGAPARRVPQPEWIAASKHPGRDEGRGLSEPSRRPGHRPRDPRRVSIRARPVRATSVGEDGPCDARRAGRFARGWPKGQVGGRAWASRFFLSHCSTVARSK